MLPTPIRKKSLPTRQCQVLDLSLHRQVYQHRIANVAEAMITDVFLAADEHFTIKGPGGEPMKLSEAAHDVRAFAKLNDSIIDAIDLSPNPALEEAARLMDALTDMHEICGMCPKKTAEGHVGNEPFLRKAVRRDESGNATWQEPTKTAAWEDLNEIEAAAHMQKGGAILLAGRGGTGKRSSRVNRRKS